MNVVIFIAYLLTSLINSNCNCFSILSFLLLLYSNCLVFALVHANINTSYIVTLQIYISRFLSLYMSVSEIFSHKLFIGDMHLVPQGETPLVRSLWFRCISRIEISQNRAWHRRSHDTGRWNCLYRSALLALLRELCRIRRVIFFQFLLLSSDKISSILQHRLLHFCRLHCLL